VDHLVLLVWHATLVSVFFAFLWRNDGRERRALLLKTFLIMVVGGILLGWLMFPFP
jgi:predicted membrane channel-forming protein YqfA (hemolysin III family)